MIRALSLCCGLVLAGPLAAAVDFHTVLRQPAAWYGTAEARAVAASMLRYQSPEGGWPTDVDTTVPPSPVFLASKPSARAPTIDDGATTVPLETFARIVTATADPGLQAAFLRGFDYLLAAQYAEGGWPQYFPLRPGYYSHITYNDQAMVNVLTLLRESAAGRAPYAFVDEDRRERAARAVARGLDCILRTQVTQDGQRTVWCAQHDEHTYAPAWARHFEPPSLSGNESVGIVRFLMAIEQPSAEVVAAIEGAVAWFATAQLSGLRVESFIDGEGRRDRRIVADPAAPPLWARFYELGTNRPIYAGRDQLIHYDFNEIEYERRNGYAYLGAWPANLLAKDYPRWRAKHKLP